MDWTTVLTALIASIPPTLVAAAGLIAALHAGRKVDAVHVDINSRMDELVTSTAVASDATGELRGRQEERALATETPPPPATSRRAK